MEILLQLSHLRYTSAQKHFKWRAVSCYLGDVTLADFIKGVEDQARSHGHRGGSRPRHRQDTALGEQQMAHSAVHRHRGTSEKGQQHTLPGLPSLRKDAGSESCSICSCSLEQTPSPDHRLSLHQFLEESYFLVSISFQFLSFNSSIATNVEAPHPRYSCILVAGMLFV